MPSNRRTRTEPPKARHEALAKELTAQARSLPRDPRSAEYWVGVECAAARRLGKALGVALGPFVVPWRTGTAQADAFLSGTDEGHRLAQRWIEENGNA